MPLTWRSSQQRTAQENASGANYNLETVQPVVHSNTFQHVIRVDYQASSKLRVSAKYAGSNSPVFTSPGSIPGFNDQVTQFPANLIPSATVDYTLNARTVFEGTWGAVAEIVRQAPRVLLRDVREQSTDEVGECLFRFRSGEKVGQAVGELL